MTKQEINKQLEEILQHKQITEHDQEEYNRLSILYSELKQNSSDQQLQDFINTGGDEIEFSYQLDDEDSKYNNLSTTYKQRFEKQINQELERKAQAIEQRKQLISELRGIAKTDVKNLGKNFQIANDVQDRWKEIPEDNSPETEMLEREYKILLDTFYYDAQIVKDAIELDYQKNLEAKQKVVEKIRLLHTEEDVITLEKKIKQYEKEWYRIGPVKREIRDESKQELESAVESLQPKLDELYQEQEGLLEENFNKKIALCKELNTVLDKAYNTPKQYQQAADRVIDLQNQWREIGRSTKNDEVWEIFSKACDSFFDQKRDYFKHLASNRKENKQAKLALIEQAEKYKDSSDWKGTSKQLIGLQKQWKSIGPAHPAEDQRLWERFRSTCDYFFNKRKDHFKEQDAEYQENLEKKNALISELKEFAGNDISPSDIKELQIFERKYKEIGYVPFKQKDRVHKEFFGTLNEIYNKLNIDQEEKQRLRYETKIKSIAKGKKPDKSLAYEKNKISQRIKELQSKIAQYENNFSFSSDSSESPIAKMIMKDRKAAENELQSLELQLELIKQAKSGKYNVEEE